jgi:hypothetical protein
MDLLLPLHSHIGYKIGETCRLSSGPFSTSNLIKRRSVICLFMVLLLSNDTNNLKSLVEYEPDLKVVALEQLLLFAYSHTRLNSFPNI